VVNPQLAASAIEEATPLACRAINALTSVLFRTRGGRIGSGMGSVLEALWGFYANRCLYRVNAAVSEECELGWFSDHGYNDFACVQRDAQWDSATRVGELLRVEAKSMNIQADESKGHFDEIVENLGEPDLLLVLVWSWVEVPSNRQFPYVYPRILDYFVGSVRAVANLRDELHLCRGGSFIDRNSCPDKCVPELCLHHGEPLNASGNRERISGPKNRKPANTSHAANFGGLVRMLKTNSPPAKLKFRELRLNDIDAHSYISFIHRNYPKEEANQYSTNEWRAIAKSLGIAAKMLSKEDLISQIQARDSNYRERLRNISSYIRSSM
jgi:hypothetical protein